MVWTYPRSINNSESLDYSYFPFQKGRSLWSEESHRNGNTWKFQIVIGKEVPSFQRSLCSSSTDLTLIPLHNWALQIILTGLSSLFFQQIVIDIHCEAGVVLHVGDTMVTKQILKFKRMQTPNVSPTHSWHIRGTS